MFLGFGGGDGGGVGFGSFFRKQLWEVEVWIKAVAVKMTLREILVVEPMCCVSCIPAPGYPCSLSVQAEQEQGPGGATWTVESVVGHRVPEAGSAPSEAA